MTGSDNPSEPVPSAALRFMGSESLAHVVEKAFIKPELRREFARRSFYLYLRTEDVVGISTRVKSVEAVLRGHDPLEQYNIDISLPQRGHNLYSQHLPLSSQVIGGAELPAPRRGINLLFRLAVSEHEKERLLAPPFDDAMAGAMYITRDIDARWLPQDILSDQAIRSQALDDMRAELGIRYAPVRRRGYLLDSYYVTHPTAVVVHSPVLSHRKAQ